MPDNDIAFSTYGVDFTGVIQAFLGANQFQDWLAFFVQVWSVYTIIAFVLSFLFIVGIIYSYIWINHYAELELQQLLHQERLWQEMYGQPRNTKWQKVVQHTESDNPNDWKLAIIEADILLDQALIERGYAGNTLGERLKSASPTTFSTLDDAWQAHLVRNKIAHDGDDFVLTKKTAVDTIRRYQRVFSELGMV